MNHDQFPSACRTTKIKRGAQQGNQNARKHGFYSNTLNISEICEFWKSVNEHNVAPEIAVLQIKLSALLSVAPDNQRARKEAVKLLAKWYSAKYSLGETDSRYLKKVISNIVTDGATSSLVDKVYGE